jgi:hypothetical protein
MTILIEATAIAIQEGKIIAIGTKEELSRKYQSRNTHRCKSLFTLVCLMHTASLFIILASYCQEVDCKKHGGNCCQNQAFQKS